MGLPLREETESSSDSSGASQRISVSASMGSESASYLFEYGNLRPDIPDSAPLASVAGSTKAWLLGSRLYSFDQRGGVEHPAVRLEESGYAVLGYVMKARQDQSIHGLLQESERRQYSPSLYDRTTVEVVTESGEPVRCYIYHRSDTSLNNPIMTGDWRSRRNQ